MIDSDSLASEEKAQRTELARKPAQALLQRTTNHHSETELHALDGVRPGAKNVVKETPVARLLSTAPGLSLSLEIMGCIENVKRSEENMADPGSGYLFTVQNPEVLKWYTPLSLPHDQLLTH